MKDVGFDHHVEAKRVKNKIKDLKWAYKKMHDTCIRSGGHGPDLDVFPQYYEVHIR